MKVLTVFFLTVLLLSGTSHALSEAMKLMLVSCEKNGEPKACYNLANMFVKSGEKDKAEKYFELACKREFEPACKRKLWDPPKKEDTKKKEQVKFLSKACEKLFEAIANCSEFTCTQPNLLAPGQTVRHTVTGEGLDNYCKYTYNLSEGRVMICFMDKMASKNFRDRTELEGLELLDSYRKNGICNEKEE